MPSVYDTFIESVKQIGEIETIASVLDWDTETNMPPNGLSARAEQVSLLAAMAHEKKTDPRLGESLQALHGRIENEDQVANVREMQRAYDRAVKVPGELVREIAKATTMAKDAWAKARKDSDFPQFAPHLETILKLMRQVADAVGYEAERYDALLDEFEPGATAAEIEGVFTQLRKPLSEFVHKIRDAKNHPDASILERNYPRTGQEKLCRRFAEAIGFDFESGRIDVSTHPFCSGFAPGDVRLTTRYDEHFFPSAIFGTMHEAGHGMYEQGLPAEHLFTPRGRAASLGIHESQSRLWENVVGRSRAFWEHFYPETRAAFPEALSDVSLDQFYRAINTVSPSFIRVEADEVTYNLHIILRFELERGLLDGKIAVNDLPEAWKTKMKELLGVVPTKDSDGCLQDIHWSMGAIGYFPTYALGNLYAAQFYAAAMKAMPDLTDRIGRGELRPLLDWLRQNIHRYGQLYRAGDLVKKVTGAPLSIEPYLNYLYGKFGPIYGIK